MRLIYRVRVGGDLDVLILVVERVVLSMFILRIIKRLDSRHQESVKVLFRAANGIVSRFQGTLQKKMKGRLLHIVPKLYFAAKTGRDPRYPKQSKVGFQR